MFEKKYSMHKKLARNIQTYQFISETCAKNPSLKLWGAESNSTYKLLFTDSYSFGKAM